MILAFTVFAAFILVGLFAYAAFTYGYSAGREFGRRQIAAEWHSPPRVEIYVPGGGKTAATVEAAHALFTLLEAVPTVQRPSMGISIREHDREAFTGYVSREVEALLSYGSLLLSIRGSDLGSVNESWTACADGVVAKWPGPNNVASLAYSRAKERYQPELDEAFARKVEAIISSSTGEEPC